MHVGYIHIACIVHWLSRRPLSADVEVFDSLPKSCDQQPSLSALEPRPGDGRVVSLVEPSVGRVISGRQAWGLRGDVQVNQE